MNEHGLQTEGGRKARVSLANGSVLFTSTYVRIFVNFGTVGGMMLFTVLPECPLILGMPFLRKFNPHIDWRTGKV